MGVNPFAYWPQPVPFSQDTIKTPVICSQSNSSSVSQNSELVSSFKEVLSAFKKKSMSDDLATFLPGFLPCKLNIGSLFALLVRKYLI